MLLSLELYVPSRSCCLYCACVRVWNKRYMLKHILCFQWEEDSGEISLPQDVRLVGSWFVLRMQHGLRIIVIVVFIYISFGLYNFNKIHCIDQKLFWT